MDQANSSPSDNETTNEEDKLCVIHMLQTSDPVRYGNLNKKLQNGSYAGRGKYQNTSGGDYELMVHRSGIYQPIDNGGNGGGRGHSNGRGNQQNQRQNIILLQQESNGGNFNGCPTEDKLVAQERWFNLISIMLILP